MQQTNFSVGSLLRRTELRVNGYRPAAPAIQENSLPAVSGVIASLLAALKSEEISYCHWKSNWRIDDWLWGEGDLDLLVAREDVPRFQSVLHRLGFKKALVRASAELPGIVNYYSYDSDLGKFIHIHAHYQLVLGHDASKNYRLPIEDLVLGSARNHGPVRIVSPEVEFGLFVIRMMLKYSPFEALVRRALGKSEGDAICRELDFLRGRVNERILKDSIRGLFPGIGAKLIFECEKALLERSTARLVVLRRRLERALRPLSRMSRIRESGKRLWNYANAVGRKVGLWGNTKKSFESGGCLVAFVGGDGSGKSMCSVDISDWLGGKFKVKRVHLGMPARSVPTLLVIGAIRVRRMATRIGNALRFRPVERFDPFDPRIDLLERLRWLATARDRRLLYENVRRFASNGGIAICDRYPVEQLKLMDGPRIARSFSAAPSWLERVLANAERRYYDGILPPDKVIVLRVKPDLAVQRKTNEPTEHVIRRSREVWRANWTNTTAHVVDAGQPQQAVIEEVRSHIWKAL